MRCAQTNMRLLALSALLVSVQLCAGVPQLYQQGNTYFRSPAQLATVSAEAVTVSLASLLSIPPPLRVSPEIAAQVLNVKPTKFIVEAINTLTDQSSGSAGGATGAARLVQQASCGARDRRCGIQCWSVSLPAAISLLTRIPVCAKPFYLADLGEVTPAAQIVSGSQGSQASQLVASFAHQGLVAEGAVNSFPLDYTALQGCGRSCLEESLKVPPRSHSHAYANDVTGAISYNAQCVTCISAVMSPLQRALAAIGATYSPGAGSLNGTVTYDDTSIPLDSTAGQLWATEVATLYQTSQDAAQEQRRR